MFLEFLGAVFSLDFAYVLRVVSEQWVWVFLLAAAAVYMYPSNKHWWAFVFMIFLNWTFVEASGYMGWTINSYFPFFFFVLVAVPFAIFLEHDKSLSKYNFPLQLVAVVLIWAFITFWM